MILQLKRTPGLYLVGFMGSGKTTIGRLLSESLGWHFADIDEEIEAAAAKPICDIFDSEGEPAFRALENEVIRRRIAEIERGYPTVVALGGGAFAHRPTYELLENNGVTVWLDCPFEIVEQRVRQATHRPLARDPVKFARLYEERRVAYSRAHCRVDAGGEPAEVVASILRLPLFD